MNITLLEDKVLVKIPEETKTSSGLVVSRGTDTANFKKGSVVKVGPGKMNDNGIRESLTVKEEDEVMFSYGEEILVEDKKYFLIKESDIAVVFNK